MIGVLGGIGIAAIGVRAILAAPALATAAAGAMPIVASAQGKLSNLATQFNTTADQLVNTAMNASKYVDHANAGNINALFARPDAAAGFVRVTFDPNMHRVISAGLMRADQVSNAIANGRFTPY